MSPKNVLKYKIGYYILGNNNKSIMNKNKYSRIV